MIPPVGVHPQQSDSGHVLGLLLAQQRRRPRPGGAGGDDCPHYDDAHGQRERGPS